jgi:hypothetical protein
MSQKSDEAVEIPGVPRIHEPLDHVY